MLLPQCIRVYNAHSASTECFINVTVTSAVYSCGSQQEGGGGLSKREAADSARERRRTQQEGGGGLSKREAADSARGRRRTQQEGGGGLSKREAADSARRRRRTQQDGGGGLSKREAADSAHEEYLYVISRNGRPEMSENEADHVDECHTPGVLIDVKDAVKC